MTNTLQKKANQYNDKQHNYLHYWHGRDYEHAAEEIAIKRLLAGRHFTHAVDIGGGYGRLCVLLNKYAHKVTLIEPSQRQLSLAKTFLCDYPKIDRKLGQADKLPLKDKSIDLLLMVRVMHHIPDPTREFSEIARVVKDDGYILLEVANYTHMLNRLKYVIMRKSLPKKPVDIRSLKNRRANTVPFVNHNPATVIRQLHKAGFVVDSVLSVSNFRNTYIKNLLPKVVLLWFESLLQPLLAHFYFGPSIFFLLRKRR